MTKRLFFSALLCCFALISCETESTEETETANEENTTSVALLGTWNFAAYIDGEGEELATDCESNQILDFQENGVFRFTYYGEDSGTCEMNQDATGSWELLSENSIALDYGVDSYEVDYSISENVLTLTIDEGEGEYQERYVKQ